MLLSRCALLGALLLSLVMYPVMASAARKTIRVKSVEALVQAIGSNRMIILEGGTYKLPHKRVPAGWTTKYVRWAKVYDGVEMRVRNVRNLALVGAGGAKAVTLLARPRYSWIMRFDNAENISIKGITFGHVPGGSCVGGVLSFRRSTNISIDASRLFGSGTYGIGLNDVKGFKTTNSEIYECTYGIAQITRASKVVFRNVLFRANREFDLFEIARSKVRFEACTFKKNYASSGNSMFKLDRRSRVVLYRSTFTKNRMEKLSNRPKRISAIKTPTAMRWLRVVDPEYNQIYKLIRYKDKLIAGTQAGLVVWDVPSGTVESLKKAFISSSLIIHKGVLWAGTYRTIQRYTKKGWQRYLKVGARGVDLFKGAAGELLAKAGARVWRYNEKKDRWRRVSSARYAAYLGHDTFAQPNGTIWKIRFLRSIIRTKGKQRKVYKLRTSGYPGSSPVSFYQDPGGSLWVVDTDQGPFLYRPGMQRFVRFVTFLKQASDMAVSPQLKRIWLLDYRTGLYLIRKNGTKRFFNLSYLKYMRCLHLDTNGDVWVGGWGEMVRVYQSGTFWKVKRYKVK